MPDPANVLYQQLEDDQQAAYVHQWALKHPCGAGGADLGREMSEVKHTPTQSQPLPVSGGLVERMIGAWFDTPVPAGINLTDHAGYQIRMTAVLRVSAEELLAEPTRDEVYEAKWRGDTGLFIATIRTILASRRARLFAPPVDPAVEAVRGFLEGVPDESIKAIVAAVRKADAESKEKDHA